MPKFETKHRAAFTASQMYALVADVERYPEFLPMCTALTVLSRATREDGEELTARMSVGYKHIAESFMTRVALHPAARLIEVRYLDGPFRYLENRWRFEDCDNGSIVDFYIHYEFKSPILAVLMGALFDKAFRKFTEAFDTRAEAVYGRAATTLAAPVGSTTS